MCIVCELARPNGLGDEVNKKDTISIKTALNRQKMSCVDSALLVMERASHTSVKSGSIRQSRQQQSVQPSTQSGSYRKSNKKNLQQVANDAKENIPLSMREKNWKCYFFEAAPRPLRDARKALQHAADMALSAPRGQTRLRTHLRRMPQYEVTGAGFVCTFFWCPLSRQGRPTGVYNNRLGIFHTRAGVVQTTYTPRSFAPIPCSHTM